MLRLLAFIVRRLDARARERLACRMLATLCADDGSRQPRLVEGTPRAGQSTR